MQEAKHTPGPWFIRFPYEDCDNPPHLMDAEGNHVPVSRRGDPLARANRNLITAAPDMLRALELIVNSDMAMREEDEGEISTELAHARAAIAKATASEGAA